jgi:hypothetical protein
MQKERRTVKKKPSTDRALYQNIPATIYYERISRSCFVPTSQLHVPFAGETFLTSPGIISSRKQGTERSKSQSRTAITRSSPYARHVIVLSMPCFLKRNWDIHTIPSRACLPIRTFTGLFHGYAQNIRTSACRSGGNDHLCDCRLS